VRTWIAALWACAAQVSGEAAEPPPLSNPAADPVAQDLARVRAVAAAMDGMAEEMSELQLGFRLVERGHYSADEHDRIERLLFRFLGCRDALWDVIDRHRGEERPSSGPDADSARAFLLAFHAGLVLADASSLLVSTFVEDERVVRKLNEAYPRTGIPAGSFDALFRGLTRAENLEALRLAWQVFSLEWRTPESPLRAVLESDPGFRPLRLEIVRRRRDADVRIAYLLHQSSLLAPEIRNRLRHSSVAELAGRARRSAGEGYGALKGFLFTHGSRLRAPRAEAFTLDAAQLAALRAQLRPGDVVLTYSDGYMSNLFLPGVFKHGLVYVGAGAVRGELDVDAAAAEWPEERRARLAADWAVAQLPGGGTADLIEAVAEGVVFNSLDRLARGQVARLAVLRPRVSEAERAGSLARTFLLLGNAYDFDFDFVDGSRHCCTEVIYRALHGVGPIAFELVPRAGVQTLSADDILKQQLRREGPSGFSVVAMAEAGSGGAKIHPAEAAERRLREWLDLDR
jgi:hypothetical protein